MTEILEEDVIQSVADALQFISYYHPTDFIKAMERAYKSEQSPLARDAIAQILTNSRMCAEGRRPICQDTGIVVAFVKVGMDVRFKGTMGLQSMVNEGVRRAYTAKVNPLRASIVRDPCGLRTNTQDNTPAVVHVTMEQGDTVEFSIAAKGGGSENKAQLAMLNPNDNLVEWVVKKVQEMGAGWCPPGVLGIGVGGTAEKAVLLAKESLMAPIDLDEVRQRGPANTIERLRLEIADRINELGIGAQGLGGQTTVLDVKILDYPTHAASLPVALIPNCAANRHVHFKLNGNGAATLEPPDLSEWPQIAWSPNEHSRRVNLDQLTKDDILEWRSGETLLLNGKLLTGRDAAHKRIEEILNRGDTLPAGVNFKNRFIYYVGPVNPVGEEVVGPAGPTTATRMDSYVDFMLQQTGLLGMIGKAERGAEAINSITRHKSVYLIAVGGAAYLVSKSIRSARVVAFADLGMEAIYEFEVKDMPVTVAVDSGGHSIHHQGPAQWRRIQFTEK